jgi:hypothetical protein
MSKKPLTFVLSDETVNRFSFRVLTAGIDLSEFKKNPIMLWMHKRDSKFSVDNMLPIGIWTNIRVENNMLLADAEFDEDDEFAMKVKAKVEKGHIRMASAGLDPKEWSEDEKHMLPGQKNPTLTISEIVEASIADIGANKNALRLYKEGEIVELSAFKTTFIDKPKPEKIQMKKLTQLLNLAAESTDDQIHEAVQAVMNRNQQLSSDLTAKDQTIADLNKQLADVNKQKVIDLVNTAITEKRIDETMRNEYTELATENFERAQKIINSLPKVGSVTQQLSQGADADTKDLSWDQLHKEGKLETLKAEKPEVFKALYKAKFKKDYAG